MSAPTESEKRVLIARALGWKWEPSRERQKLGYLISPTHQRVTVWKGWTFGGERELPDWAKDLNACAEMEKWLKNETGHLSVRCLIRDYWIYLMEEMNPGVRLWDNGTFLGDWSHAIRVGEATAAQRAESFGRACGLWSAPEQK